MKPLLQTSTTLLELRTEAEFLRVVEGGGEEKGRPQGERCARHWNQSDFSKSCKSSPSSGGEISHPAAQGLSRGGYS